MWTASRPSGPMQGTEYATRGARGARSARPHLRMVSPLRPERASRGVFALVVTGLLGVGMVLILVINTSLAQGAFTISELQAQQSTLTQQEQTLAEAVAAAAAPESLEAAGARARHGAQREPRLPRRDHRCGARQAQGRRRRHQLAFRGC